MLRMEPIGQGMSYECVGLTPEGLCFRLALTDSDPLRRMLPPGTWEHRWTVPIAAVREAEQDGRTDQFFLVRRRIEERAFVDLLTSFVESCA